MRFSSEVTAQDCEPVGLHVDPSAPGYGTHLPFFLILQRCGVAWREFLVATGTFADSVIVPHLTADFQAEITVGTIDVEVGVVAVGNTSFTIRCAVFQDGTSKAQVDVVLVCFDYDGGSKVALSDDQRDGLSGHLIGLSTP